MNKFHTWLEKNPGAATKIRASLNVNATCVSNVKHERRPMPTRWMPVVIKETGGKLTADYLLGLRNKVIKKLKTASTV